MLRFFAVLAFGGALYAQPLSYTVASIKPDKSGDYRFIYRNLPGGRFTATGVTVKMLIMQAYKVPAYEILGGPSWILNDKWDVEAKADGIQGDHSAELMQSLLADRFQLKVHRETKQVPEYALVVAKGGSKMKASTNESGESKERVQFGRGQAIISDMSIPRFADFLSRELGRPVMDRTDLKGKYGFKLEWAPAPGESGAESLGLPPVALPPPSADSTAPSIFTALEEQLGLKLESTKGPAEMVVIDHVERPSEN